MERSETITLGTLGILDHFSSLVVISTFNRFRTLPPDVIAVVINMFRLADFLTEENIICNRLKLLQT
jgi:hypothetical protein